MTAPRWLAHFNRQVMNRLFRPLAPHLPSFGVVVHTGRKTRRLYRTPVNVFRHAEGYVVALTYGRDADWVRNVLASGGCTLDAGPYAAAHATSPVPRRAAPLRAVTRTLGARRASGRRLPRIQA